MSAEQGLVTQLVEALVDMLSEVGSAAGHIVSQTAIAEALSAIARATPEGVRNADAAPEMYAVLSEWADSPVACVVVKVRRAPVAGCDCWACARTRDSIAAIAKAEGR